MTCAGSTLFLFAIVVVSPPADLSGWWYVRDDVTGSAHSPFVGLDLGFAVELEQEGAWLFGRGEKTCERGRRLPARARTPIALVGTVDAGRVTARLIEDGRARRTAGTFTWTVSPDGERLDGTFTATAGESKGRSVARRMAGRPPACGPEDRLGDHQ